LQDDDKQYKLNNNFSQEAKPTKTEFINTLLKLQSLSSLYETRVIVLPADILL